MTACLVVAGVLLLLFSLFCLVAGVAAVVVWKRRSQQAQAATPAASTGQAPASTTPRAPAPSAPSALVDATMVVPPLQNRYGKIVYLSGPTAGTSLDVSSRGLWIGRDASADVIVQSSRVSKRHAWVGVRGEQAVVIDEASTNGTFLEGRCSDRLREHVLSPGDIIVIADDVARFRYDGN